MISVRERAPGFRGRLLAPGRALSATSAASIGGADAKTKHRAAMPQLDESLTRCLTDRQVPEAGDASRRSSTSRAVTADE
jgi:hypothetical protein